MAENHPAATIRNATHPLLRKAWPLAPTSSAHGAGIDQGSRWADKGVPIMPTHRRPTSRPVRQMSLASGYGQRAFIPGPWPSRHGANGRDDGNGHVFPREPSNRSKPGRSSPSMPQNHRAVALSAKASSEAATHLSGMTNAHSEKDSFSQNAQAVPQNRWTWVPVSSTSHGPLRPIRNRPIVLSIADTVGSAPVTGLRIGSPLD